jgi:hypothetical protein
MRRLQVEDLADLGGPKQDLGGPKQVQPRPRRALLNIILLVDSPAPCSNRQQTEHDTRYIWPYIMCSGKRCAPALKMQPSLSVILTRIQQAMRRHSLPAHKSMTHQLFMCILPYTLHCRTFQAPAVAQMSHHDRRPATSALVVFPIGVAITAAGSRQRLSRPQQDTSNHR